MTVIPHQLADSLPSQESKQNRIFGCRPPDSEKSAIEVAFFHRDRKLFTALSDVYAAENDYQAYRSVDISSLSWDEMLDHCNAQHSAYRTLNRARKRFRRQAKRSGYLLREEKFGDVAGAAALGAPRQLQKNFSSPNSTPVASTSNPQTTPVSTSAQASESQVNPSSSAEVSKPGKTGSGKKGVKQDRADETDQLFADFDFFEPVSEYAPIPYDYVSLTESPDAYVEWHESVSGVEALKSLQDLYGHIGMGQYRLTRGVWNDKGKIDYRLSILREFSKGPDGKMQYKMFQGTFEEKIRIIDDLCRDARRNYRYWLHHYLRYLVYKDWLRRSDAGDPLVGAKLPSLTGCMAGTFTRFSKELHEEVKQFEIHEKDGGISFVGLTKCGSMLCPICAPIISAKRMEEYLEMCYAMLNKGYSMVFVTRTASHGRHDSFRKIYTGFKDATNKMRSSHAYKQIAKKINGGNSLHFFSGYETTLDDTSYRFELWSGFHYHVHEVYFLKPEDEGRLTQKEIDEFESLITKAWTGALEKVGLNYTVERCIHFDPVSHFFHFDGLKYANRKANAILDRFAKKHGLSDPEKKPSPKQQAIFMQCLKMVEYMTKSLCFEVTGGMRKKARHNGKGTPRIGVAQLIERAVFGDRVAQRKYFELFWESRGAHWFDTSRGLKKLCGLEKEDDKTDEQLLMGASGHQILAFGVGGQKNAESGYDNSFEDFNEDSWKFILTQGRFGHFRSVLERAYVRGGRAEVREVARVAVNAAASNYDIQSFKKLAALGCADHTFESVPMGVAGYTKLGSGLVIPVEDEMECDDFSLDDKVELENLQIDKSLDDAVRAEIASKLDALVKDERRFSRFAGDRTESGVMMWDGGRSVDVWLSESAAIYVRMGDKLDELVEIRKKAGYDMSDVRSWAYHFIPTWYDAASWRKEFQDEVAYLRGEISVPPSISSGSGQESGGEKVDLSDDVSSSVSRCFLGGFEDYRKVKIDYYRMPTGEEHGVVFKDNSDDLLGTSKWRKWRCEFEDYLIVDAGTYDDCLKVATNPYAIKRLEHEIRVALGADKQKDAKYLAGEINALDKGIQYERETGEEYVPF